MLSIKLEVTLGHIRQSCSDTEARNGNTSEPENYKCLSAICAYLANE